MTKPGHPISIFALMISLTLLMTNGGCSLGIDFDPGITPFMCEDSGKCADNFTCKNNLCVFADSSGFPADDGSSSDPGAKDIGVKDLPSQDAPETSDQPSVTDAPETSDQSPITDTTDVGPIDVTPLVPDDGSSSDSGPPVCDEGIPEEGCCVGNTVKTCTPDGPIDMDCNNNLGLCGWNGNFYGCGTDGLADPNNEHLFTCPNEECTPSCTNTECAADGCGGLCGCDDENATCNQSGECDCKEGYELIEEVCTLPCPDICTNECALSNWGVSVCKIDCDQDSPVCEELITCPDGWPCWIVCNKQKHCSQGIEASDQVSQVVIDCIEDETCRGPIFSHAPQGTTVTCSDSKACRRCPSDKVGDECSQGGFQLNCSGEECTLNCTKNNNKAEDGVCNGVKNCSASECNFNCTGKWSCVGPITCDQDQVPVDVDSSCTVTCGVDGNGGVTNACKGIITAQGSRAVDISCHSNSGCTSINAWSVGTVQVHCEGNGSCATINAENAESVHIECNGSDSCKTLPPPMNGVVHCDASSCSVECDGVNSCNDVLIENTNLSTPECPQAQSSCLGCTGSNSCGTVVFKETSNSYILCQGTNSCISQVRCENTTDECTFYCSGDQSCKGHIGCLGQDDSVASCNLQCVNSNACSGGSFVCDNMSTCTVQDPEIFGNVAVGKHFYYDNISEPESQLTPNTCNFVEAEFCNNGATGCCFYEWNFQDQHCCNWEPTPVSQP